MGGQLSRPSDYGSLRPAVSLLSNHQWLTLNCPWPVPSSLGDFQACLLQARCASTGCECLPREQVGGNYSSRSRPWLEAKGTILSSCQEQKQCSFSELAFLEGESNAIQGWSKSLGPCGRCWRVLEILKPHPSRLPPLSIDIPCVVNICYVHMFQRSFFFGEEKSNFPLGNSTPQQFHTFLVVLQDMGCSHPSTPKGWTLHSSDSPENFGSQWESLPTMKA